MQLNLFCYYRFHNKGVYVKASLKNMSKSNMANLQDRLQLTVDGLDVPLPNLEGLCVLNIGRLVDKSTLSALLTPALI